MNQKRKRWVPKPIPPEVVFPSFGLPEEDMKLKQVMSEDQTLNLAIKYLEYSKDQLYNYVRNDEYARESIRKWFPIDDFLNSIDEGKELADSDILKLIKVIDDIILAIVNGVVDSKKFEEKTR